MPNQKTIPKWHALALSEALTRLRADAEAGLADSESAKRLTAFGKNTLPQGKQVTALEMTLRQFKSPLVYILLVAAALNWWLHEYVDMSVILLVVAVNAVIGFYQDFRASKIFEKLKSLVRVEALVMRSGKIRAIDSEELVPGDLIILKSGDKIPADARLIKTDSLETNEALLTGESKAVKKQPGTSADKALVGDRANMVFMGTSIEAGDGTAFVVCTGAKTEIGQISAMTQSAQDEDTPLQRRVAGLGKFLTELILAMAGAIFLVGMLLHHGFVQMITTSIAAAIAALPEGLPAAITVILAVASQRLLKRQGLVMRLVAAETLGSTSVICADKTGTLTYGEMRVEKLVSKNKDAALLAMALANEAVIEERDGKQKVRGEATDRAKLEYYLKGGGNIEKTLADLPRLGLVPFDSARKYIASLHHRANRQAGGKKGDIIFLSGAPEVLLKTAALPPARKKTLLTEAENLAQSGYRVIGLGQKTMPASRKPSTREALIKQVREIEFLGLAALRDPIREDVKQTLTVTRNAGIKVLMLTGDHVLTARSIGAELGFGVGPEALISGEELDRLDAEELQKRIGKIEIVARITPEHKMRIIDAWQKMGAVVAMTGDGVNDAPALKSADIGVAVGSGTDVAKEASDLILLNDSFSTITAAVEEGRVGFENIKKVTILLLSNGFTELVVILAALVFSLPFPITAVQILWTNLIEDGLPVLALAFEPEERGIMQRRPLLPNEPIIDTEGKWIIALGLLIDLITVAVYLWLHKYSGWSLKHIQTFMFAMIGTDTLFYVLVFKSLRAPFWRVPIFNNKLLVVSIVSGFAAILAAIYLPFMRGFFGTVPLSANLILVILAIGVVKSVSMETLMQIFLKHENL